MYVRTGVAAEILGICTRTLYRWEKAGKIVPAARTVGGHRRFDTDHLKYPIILMSSTGRPGKSEDMTSPRPVPGERAVCYARVSGNKQKDDLKRQKDAVESYCAGHGYRVVATFTDTASGLHDRRPGLLRMLDRVTAGCTDKVVVAYSDRLSRFGTGFIERVLKNHGTCLEVVNVPEKNKTGPTEGDRYRALVDDMVALVTSFAGKIHRMRRGKNDV